MPKISTQPEQVSSADDAWKEAITRFFQPFMALLFSPIATEINWAQGYKFLDKELAQIQRGHAMGKRVADKLVQVYLRNGTKRWLLIHIEVQGRPAHRFNERMYVYNYRLFDRFRVKVVSLAVILQPSPVSLGNYQSEQWGCRVNFVFPVVKVPDFVPQRNELEGSRNPFAVILLAQLRANEKKGDNDFRFAAKRELVFRLYDKGFTRADIHELFRMIDWLITLPKELEEKLEQEIFAYEERQPMDLVSRLELRAIQRGEKKGMEKGLEKGLEKGMEKGLEKGLGEGMGQIVTRQLARLFGPLDMRTQARLKKISVQQMEELGTALLDLTTVKDLKSWLEQQMTTQPKATATKSTSRTKSPKR